MQRTNSNNILELGINMLGAGASVALNTTCGAKAAGQMQLATVCYYSNGNNKIKTLGIFGKVFVM